MKTKKEFEALAKAISDKNEEALVVAAMGVLESALTNLERIADALEKMAKPQVVEKKRKNG